MSFISVKVIERQIEKAKRIRAQRDQAYGNIFDEQDTDLRWVGDLGEICFNDWLKSNQLSGFQWHLQNTAGKPDFTVSGLTIDVKTVKRKVPPKLNYTAQITARHKDTAVDHLFFCSFEFRHNRMWLLGGIAKKSFLEKATYYGAGNAVHASYVIRKDHEIYNAPISILDAPAHWLHSLK